MDRYIGRVLDGRYEILEEVGNGGMAVVYKAKDFDTGAVVAVKILREEYLDNEEFSRRFRNESRAIALLNHPNIVKILDVSNSPSLQYIVMEYIDGISLKDYIEQQRVVKIKEAVHFTTQILRALMQAHAKGIVHRDIKPQNIMLLSNGQIKVTDFGIARMSTSRTSTITDKAIGSVHYIAPEQARGANTDARADLYSVGVMLYEMLTGKLPFEASSAVSVAVMQLQADPKMPRAINPNIPVGLEEITMQAMQKDPAKRYQSAAEMLQDIEDFKRNPGIRFDYKYVAEDNIKYRKASDAAKEAEAEEEYKSPVIPVMSGIATAFVLVALVFAVLFADASGIFKKNTSEQTDLPNFVGQEYNAIIQSKKYDYIFFKEEKFSSEYAEGVVMEQTPKPNKRVYSTSKVTLYVSKGPERLMVPDYQNMTFSQYTQQLTSLGLKYVDMPVYDDSKPADIVINTNPQPREEVSLGDVIEVYYSKGPKTEEIKMSNYINTPYVAAKSELTSLGITVADATMVDSNKPEGTIISQEPSYGTKISQDTVVKFTVSNGQAPASTVRLDIDLPEDKTNDVTIEIFLNGESNKVANVSLASQDSYSVKLTGSGTLPVVVTMNGRNYRDYTVNFSEGTYDMTKEYDTSWLDGEDTAIG